ncbi:hypothetical protein [Microbacterium terrisoli]|uniref:hypothetical protein n=1 Tax=Microbacterium terrisoli TaxID=3242192 RepID=UPI002804F40E|nr:hypothetical protein [Microbacterium protaetiae]
MKTLIPTKKDYFDRGITALRFPWEPATVESWTLPLEPRVDIDGKHTPMRYLPAIALATLRYLAPPLDGIVPNSWGIVTEATCRLAHWRFQGHRRSAWQIAENLQSIYWPLSKPVFGRYRTLQADPWRGLELLRLTDLRSIGSVEWWCDVPTAHDAYTFETVRLHEAIARFDPADDSQRQPGSRFAIASPKRQNTSHTSTTTRGEQAV